MDIYSYLKKDHREVSELFEAVLTAKSADKRQALYEHIQEKLTLHAETEDATFYAALNGKLKDRIKEARHEHEEIKEYFAKLDQLPVNGEKWLEQFGELKHAVSHHVEEEEGEIFTKARQVLDQAEAKQLAREMDEMKQRMLRKAAAA